MTTRNHAARIRFGNSCFSIQSCASPAAFVSVEDEQRWPAAPIERVEEMAEPFVQPRGGSGRRHIEVLDERAQFRIHVGRAFEVEASARQSGKTQRVAENLFGDVCLARLARPAQRQETDDAYRE
jgi:hypothetical protein